MTPYTTRQADNRQLNRNEGLKRSYLIRNLYNDEPVPVLYY